MAGGVTLGGMVAKVADAATTGGGIEISTIEKNKGGTETDDAGEQDGTMTDSGGAKEDADTATKGYETSAPELEGNGTAGAPENVTGVVIHLETSWSRKLLIQIPAVLMKVPPNRKEMGGLPVLLRLRNAL